MLTPYEIAVLRKQGHLDEAYSAAKDSLATSSDNQNELLRLLGFIVCDQLKALTGAASASFLAKLKDFSDLHIPESETMIYNSLLWNLRAFVVDERKSDEDITHSMDTLFDLIRPCPFVGKVMPFPLLWVLSFIMQGHGTGWANGHYGVVSTACNRKTFSRLPLKTTSG